MRSVGKYILGQIGRKLISGDFNLTTVSFPIKGTYFSHFFPKYYVYMHIKTPYN